MQEGIQLTLNKYPETVKLDLGVAAMGVESPEGALIRTGLQLHRLRSATDLSGAVAAAWRDMSVRQGHGRARTERGGTHYRASQC